MGYTDKEIWENLKNGIDKLMEDPEYVKSVKKFLNFDEIVENLKKEAEKLTKKGE